MDGWQLIRTPLVLILGGILGNGLLICFVCYYDTDFVNILLFFLLYKQVWLKDIVRSKIAAVIFL